MGGELAGRTAELTAKKPLSLGKLVATSLGGAFVAGSGLALLFGEWLAPGDGHLWDLSSRDLYDVIRASIGSLGLIGAGGAAAIAYRRQRTTEDQHVLEARRDELAERTDQRAITAAFHARFGAAAEQLGHADAAVRISGVYAMAQLADDWGDADLAQRQVCVDVLCAYLRMPERHESSSPVLDERDIRVRETICRVIRTRLASDKPRWTNLHYDLRGAELTEGRYSFARARFEGGHIDFDGATIDGAVLRFEAAFFDRCTVGLTRMRVLSGVLDFNGARFRGDPSAPGFGSSTERQGGDIRMHSAVLEGGKMNFRGTDFGNNTSMFRGPAVQGTEFDFSESRIACNTFVFRFDVFDAGVLTFTGAQRSGGTETDLMVGGPMAGQVVWGPLSP